MAQWIPKTAWKVSNLNKRYGPSYITAGHSSADIFSHVPFINNVDIFRNKISSLNGIVMIDVRDLAERKFHPVPDAVYIHPHDLLSGAANPILPREKEASELFVISSNRQRGVNCSSALNRWGYANVFVVDYNLLAEAGYVSNLEGN